MIQLIGKSDLIKVVHEGGCEQMLLTVLELHCQSLWLLAQCCYSDVIKEDTEEAVGASQSAVKGSHNC